MTMLLAVAIFPKTALSPSVFRRTAQLLTLVYVVLLLGVLVGLEWWGERHWTLSLLLFAPPWFVLIPLPLVILLALIRWQWRLLLLQLGCVVLVIFGYCTFRWNYRPPRSPDQLKIITHNAGQGSREQFEAFLRQEQPDVILLQDAGTRATEASRMFPGYSIAVIGEYACISRYPIRKPELIQGIAWDGKPVCARFESTVGSRAVAFYAVHMATPRPQLNQFLHRRVVKELVEAPRVPREVDGYESWVADQVSRAEALSAKLHEEKLPFIVAGDFNTPDHGYIYHLFANRMTDAFAKAGRGWGMTFPGGLDGQRARSRPWLRLDYIFCGSGWQPVFCEPEAGRRSQHRAVMAILKPS